MIPAMLSSPGWKKNSPITWCSHHHVSVECYSVFWVLSWVFFLVFFFCLHQSFWNYAQKLRMVLPQGDLFGLTSGRLLSHGRNNQLLLDIPAGPLMLLSVYCWPPSCSFIYFGGTSYPLWCPILSPCWSITSRCFMVHLMFWKFFWTPQQIDTFQQEKQFDLIYVGLIFLHYKTLRF